jgi:7,8-dihydropterin-6-yl-methyl-4-(beta-D-ribofuranosyl)aminobenzene 5'-phosphate synthase
LYFDIENILIKFNVELRTYNTMKITIIYDNTFYSRGLQADWGFASLVETPERNILFDTGTKGIILLQNMKKLGIEPSQIDDVFISHNHFDHTGGLSSFLHENNDVNIYLPPSLRGVREGNEIFHVDKPMKMYENIYSTGELDGIEQSMVVSTPKGMVLVVGCSHPNMEHILNAAREFGELYGIIGGLHGFKEYVLFENLELICPTHCTKHIEEIKHLYPEKYIKGGAGRVIEIN